MDFGNILRELKRCLDSVIDHCYTCNARARHFIIALRAGPRAHGLSAGLNHTVRRLRLLGIFVFLVTFASARHAAGADAASPFSTPWDPDFAPPPQTAPAEAVLPPGAETAAVVIIPGSGPFLLMDRPDPRHILEPWTLGISTAAPAPHEFLEFADKLRPFVYSQDALAHARSDIEEGKIPGEPSPFLTGAKGEEVAASSAAAIMPPPPELEMPAQQMSLSITGRKIVGVNYTEKRYLHDQTLTGRPMDTRSLSIVQQMQLRMQGKVGPKITVNVDYDDTQANKQDISIVYQGSPDETVQNVAFGDIDLTLPATEFVSYNKQLFGIRADVKYGGLKSTVIASRTKGATKFKEFVGNTQFVSQDLLDTSYVRHQYYDVSFGTAVPRLPIKTGSEQVWLSQMNNGEPNLNQFSFTADDLGVATVTVTSNMWVRLGAGADYTMDYVNGIITFRNSLQPAWAAAIDYIDATGQHIIDQTATSRTGGTHNFKLIKTPGDVPVEAVACTTCTQELGYNRELKTVYSLGQTQIMPDNGQGSFILQVLDQQRKEAGSKLNPIQQYPNTITVDFANGLFRLQKPFAVAGDSSTIDPQIYSPTPISQRLIHTEFSYRLKTFTLEPNLVTQSETVLLNNVKLNRNVDYFIDYESGFITFFNPDRITATSKVDISYEVSAMGGVSNISLLGGRVSYDITKNASVGTTLLYQAGAKAQTVPSINDLASSLAVYDFDAKVKELHLLPKLKATFSGEFAISVFNPNLNGLAIIDNMEGIVQQTQAPVLYQPWGMASNPNGPPADPTTIAWSNVPVPTLSINPKAQASPSDSQQVLNLAYNFSAPDNTACTTKEASIVYPFSVSGVDFSQATILQVTMLGDNSGNAINFRLGGIDEDADNSGSLRTNAPTGVLQPGQDIGWLYAPLNCPHTARYGAGTGIVQTDDLNKNGRLDPDDGYGGNFGFVCSADPAINTRGATGVCTSPAADQLSSLNSGVHTKLDFGAGASGASAGWQTFYIPLNISSANYANWTAIKNIRITVAQGSGGKPTGKLQFAQIGVVGLTWQKGLAGDPAMGQTQLQSEALSVTPINNVNNPSYTPIYSAGGAASRVFNQLYGSVATLQQQTGTTNLTEGALQLDFSSMTLSSVAGSTTTVFTKRTYGRAVDFSQHKQFNFLVYGHADGTPPDNNHIFFLRVGNDSNFWEAQVPLDFTGWQEISINQTSAAGNGVMDTWTSGTPLATVVSSGTPSLQQVSELVAGVYKVGGPPDTHGRLWIDEIFLAQAETRMGQARSLSADFDWTDWATFGVKDRFLNRNFQTPTSVVSNQDNLLDSAYLNLKRPTFFPTNLNLSRAITDTANTALTGNSSNLVNQLQAGKVTTWTGGAQGNFAYRSWPRLNLSYKRLRVEYDLLTRLDDSNDYSATLQYGVPLQNRFLPKTIDLTYGYRTSLTEYSSLLARGILGNNNVYDLSQTAGARLTFIPWTGSSFNPSYSLTQVKERESDLTTGPVVVDQATGRTNEMNRSYPKSMTQSVGASANFRILPWLNPQLNFQSDINQNTILNISTVVVQSSTFDVTAPSATYLFDLGKIQTITRSANGSISLPLNLAEILPKSKLLRSVNIVAGYQLQDGDVWNNIDSAYRANLALWVRSPLRPGNSPAAQLANSTLRDTFNSTQRWSPLSSYDLGGRLAALKSLSISNNFIYSIQRSVVTGTPSKTISTTLPDLVTTISQIEKLVFCERWLNNTQMNFRYSDHKTKNIGTNITTNDSYSVDLRSVVLKRYDTLLSANYRSGQTIDLQVNANTQLTQHKDATAQVSFNIRKVYFTPKLTYTYDSATSGSGVKTQEDMVLTPSVLVRTDVALPRGLMLPGAKKAILFSNRIIWTTTLSLAVTRSPVAEANNSELASLTTSGDYEIAKNLRMTLNGALSRLWHKYLPQEAYISYQMGMNLTFQF